MNRLRSQRGNVMLEFALVTPTVFLLAFGAMDLSRVYRSAMVSAAASRAAIQYAASGVVAMDDVEGMTQRASNEAGAPSGVRISVSHYCACSFGGKEEPCTTTCSGRMRYVKVSSTVPFEPVVQIPGVASLFNLTSVSQMRIE